MHKPCQQGAKAGDQEGGTTGGGSGAATGAWAVTLQGLLLALAHDSPVAVTAALAMVGATLQAHGQPGGDDATRLRRAILARVDETTAGAALPLLRELEGPEGPEDCAATTHVPPADSPRTWCRRRGVDPRVAAAALWAAEEAVGPTAPPAAVVGDHAASGGGPEPVAPLVLVFNKTTGVLAPGGTDVGLVTLGQCLTAAAADPSHSQCVAPAAATFRLPVLAQGPRGTLYDFPLNATAAVGCVLHVTPATRGLLLRRRDVTPRSTPPVALPPGFGRPVVILFTDGGDDKVARFPGLALALGDALARRVTVLSDRDNLELEVTGSPGGDGAATTATPPPPPPVPQQQQAPAPPAARGGRGDPVQASVTPMLSAGAPGGVGSPAPVEGGAAVEEGRVSVLYVSCIRFGPGGSWGSNFLLAPEFGPGTGRG
jgi:hypothetical protein